MKDEASALAPIGTSGEDKRHSTADGLDTGPRLTVREDAPPYGYSDGVSAPDGSLDDADLVDPMALPDPVVPMESLDSVDPIASQPTSPSPPRTGDGLGDGGAAVVPMSHVSQAASLPPSAPERGSGGEGYLLPESPEGAERKRNSAPHPPERSRGDVPSQVGAKLLAEILALDLGNLTPIRALTLLHELQTAAREAVPWGDWMANLAGARVHVPPADKKTK